MVTAISDHLNLLKTITEYLSLSSRSPSVPVLVCVKAETKQQKTRSFINVHLHLSFLPKQSQRCASARIFLLGVSWFHLLLIDSVFRMPRSAPQNLRSLFLSMASWYLTLFAKDFNSNIYWPLTLVSFFWRCQMPAVLVLRRAHHLPVLSDFPTQPLYSAPTHVVVLKTAKLSPIGSLLLHLFSIWPRPMTLTVSLPHSLRITFAAW